MGGAAIAPVLLGSLATDLVCGTVLLASDGAVLGAGAREIQVAEGVDPEVGHHHAAGGLGRELGAERTEDERVVGEGVGVGVLEALGDDDVRAALRDAGFEA